MKRIFLLLAIFSCFLILSMSVIPSAQSSMVKEEIEENINNILIQSLPTNIWEIIIELLRTIFLFFVWVSIVISDKITHYIILIYLFIQYLLGNFPELYQIMMR